MLASAYIYAEEYSCDFRVLWETEPAMPHRWSDLFQIAITPPELNDLSKISRRDYATHSNNWVNSVNPFSSHTAGEAVVFRGGHTFKLDAMTVSEYNRRKQLFYQQVAAINGPTDPSSWRVSAIRRVPVRGGDRKISSFNASGCACMHYRETVYVCFALSSTRLFAFPPWTHAT